MILTQTEGKLKLNKPNIRIYNKFKATIFIDIKHSKRKLNTYKLLNVYTSESYCNTALLQKE
jgi:hypothetical protein